MADFEPVRIVKILGDDIEGPENYGSSSSGLYTIPILLSRQPSEEWARVFASKWDRPSSFSQMHRPGIARVLLDRILLMGTNLEEIERYHKSTLQLAVEETNKVIEVYEVEQRQQAEQAERERARVEEAKRKMSEAADRIKFD